MKKEKIINFINLISNNFELDYVSKENYNNLKQIIESIPMYKFKKFNKIISKSSDLITTMLQNYKSFKTNFLKQIKVEKTNYNLIRKELNFFPSFNDVKATEIKDKIYEIEKKYQYLLIIDNIKINLYFYSCNEDNSLFINLARIIYLFIKTFGNNTLDSSKIFNNYNIRLLLIDFPRKLDSIKCSSSDSFKNLSEIGYFNNSSGVHIKSEKELVVSRKSGLTGLLIHELIHMLGLDFCFNIKNNNQINIENWNLEWIKNNNIKKNNHNIRSFIESICNTNSSYFVSIYNAIHTCSLINNDNQVIKFFKYYFYIESIYCFVNGVKLLNYFNFDSFDSFFNTNDQKTFYQNSLVFEYIILRMILIENYYSMILKPMINLKFNELTTDEINYNFQKNLNFKMLNNVKKKSIKYLFNNISNNINKTEGLFIEYFPLDLLKFI